MRLTSKPKGFQPAPGAAEAMHAVWLEVCGEIHSPRLSIHLIELLDRRGSAFVGDMARWRTYCERVAASPFLRGENSSGWRATIGWALGPTNMRKVNLGNYDPKEGERSGPKPAVKAKGRTVRQVLVNGVFASSTGSMREVRVKRFIDYLMPPARGLHLRGGERDTELARHLSALLAHINEERAAARGRDWSEGDMELIWAYLDWLREQDWAATTRVLQPDSPAFAQFRHEMAYADAYGRDPLTGATRF